MIAFSLCLGMWVMDLFAASRYGMWMGLVTQKTGRAVTKTILLVLIVPMVAVVGGSCFWLLPLWPVIGIVKNLYFISRARDRLRRQFRALVTERYGSMAGGDALPKVSRRRLESELPPVLPR